MTLAATYLGANGWLLEFQELRVLVDPWLKGSLSFPPGDWLLKGELPHDRDVPEQLDLLLLTQGLADHSHPATLSHLHRSLPVIGSKGATRVAEQLGFQSVTALQPGQQTKYRDLDIRATAGAPVPQVENGYLLEHPSGCIYLEPHGFLDPEIQPRPVDAVITPMVDLGLPVLGTFVKGCSVVPQLVERFQPKTVLASTAGGDIRFNGALSGIMQMQGSPQGTGEQLPEGTNWIDPVPGKRLLLPA